MPWQEKNTNCLIIRLFIKRFDLPSASSIKSALKVLVDKDLVYQSAKGYIVYDRFLGLWLKRL